jgi:hypothetical protein
MKLRTKVLIATAIGTIGGILVPAIFALEAGAKLATL